MAFEQLLTGKLLSEFKTISAMVEIYCKAHHKSTDGDVCQDCQASKNMLIHVWIDAHMDKISQRVISARYIVTNHI